MKKQHLLLCGIALATAFASCKKDDNNNTNVIVPTSDTLSGEVSGVWKKGSTHYVKGDVFIPEGKSLVIEDGVTVQMLAGAKPEFIVKGNFYCEGTAAAPVKFIASGANETYGDQWGGILAGPTCNELLLNYVILEQGGAVTTEESSSVKAGFFKAEAGNHVPAIWYGGSGKMVVTNSIIRNFNEDGFYIEGGDVIIANNYFYTTGVAGGDAINIKSGVHADVAFNVVYSPNTNALKLSNSGDKPRQAYVIGYNNTILNCGWRRPTTKGGSIWLEKAVQADLYNNLLINNRFGIKRDKGNPEDSRSVVQKTFYYGYDQTTVSQFQPTAEIIAGANDVISATTGANDPLLVNYPLSTDVNNGSFNTSWDFHLKAGSPALTGGNTSFTRHFGNGLTLNGKTYSSPNPAAYFGALGTK
jgi:hypothetical protein